MDSVAMPPEVAATLRAAGYGVRGPAGVGSGGPVWTAVGPVVDGVGADRVVVHALAVPGGAAGDAVVQRLDALRRLDHPHLARIADVLTVGSAEAAPGHPAARTVAVLVEEVPGTTLAALLAARAPLTPGEVVALTVPLAGALATLHAAGLVHGDVSPGNVVVRPDGHPVLIDLLGAVDPPAPRSRGRGTPGFVAPEVAAGADRSLEALRPPSTGDGREPADPPAGAPADVYGLATVALTALDPADADGPLGQELSAALAPDPVLRPTAGELAAGCYARAVPAPIALPDAGVLAAAALAQLAGEGRTVSVDRRSRHRAPDPRRRGARRVLGAAALATVAAAVAVVLAVPGLSLDAGVSRPATDDAAGASDVRGHLRPDPEAAAADLTRRRLEVLCTGDADALDDVVVAGSPAAAADRALLDGLAAGHVRIEALTATGVTARVQPAPGGATTGSPAATEGALDQRVDVAVTSGLSAHRRVTPDGTVDVPEQPPRTVVLALVWTPDGWRVDAVRDP